LLPPLLLFVVLLQLLLLLLIWSFDWWLVKDQASALQLSKWHGAACILFLTCWSALPGFAVCYALRQHSEGDQACHQ